MNFGVLCFRIDTGALTFEIPPVVYFDERWQRNARVPCCHFIWQCIFGIGLGSHFEEV